MFYRVSNGGTTKYIICLNDVDCVLPFSVHIPNPSSNGHGYLMYGSSLAVGILYELDFANETFTKLTSAHGQNMDLVEQRTRRSYDKSTNTLSQIRTDPTYGLGEGHVIFFY